MLKILLIAYACEPHRGSEPGVGWNWAVHLSKYAKVTVITRANNKAIIEKEINQNIITNLNFIYYDIPLFVSYKNILPFGVQFYYLLWQYLIIRIIKAKGINNFDFIQHTTFNSITLPFFLYKLKSRLILGPLGGGQTTKIKFLSTYRYKILKEILRTAIVQLNKVNPFLIKNIRAAEKIFVVNDETLSFIPDRYLFKTVKLLETAIPDTFLKCSPIQKCKTNLSVINLMWVGDLEPHKGLIYLLKALVLIKNNFHLKIIGSGSLEAYYKKIITNYRLSEKITFYGKINYEEMATAYNSADVFVFTSIRDSSGNVVLEAMSQGLPVICFKHQGVKEIVSSDCGILIDPKEKNIPEKLSQSINLLLENNEKRVSYGQNARKRILEMFTWDDKIKKVYGENEL